MRVTEPARELKKAHERLWISISVCFLMALMCVTLRALIAYVLGGLMLVGLSVDSLKFWRAAAAGGLPRVVSWLLCASTFCGCSGAALLDWRWRGGVPSSVFFCLILALAAGHQVLVRLRWRRVAQEEVRAFD